MSADEQTAGTFRPDEQPGWNELGFVPWRAFRRMAPSILTLEVSRLADLMQDARSVEFRNALVKSRHELGLFVNELKKSESNSSTCDTLHLQTAILNLPVNYPGIDSKTVATLNYILDRLQYVHNRIRFVYQ